MSSPSILDPVSFKAQTREQWDKAADGWFAQRMQIRAWLREPTRAMLDLAEVGRGASVLDVAAGAGDQTLDIAERVGSEGYVLATDISAKILHLAEKNARQAGFANVHVQEADGERLDVPCIFDAAICRLGLMFYPDPLAGLQAMWRALKPGGRACALVFSEAAQNPCISILMATASKHAGIEPCGADRPGGFLSLGRTGRMQSLFEGAGFVGVQTMRSAAPMRLPTVDHYLDFVRTSAGPILQLLAPLDDRAKEEVWADMAGQLRQFDTTEGWVGPNELLLSVGRR